VKPRVKLPGSAHAHESLVHGCLELLQLRGVVAISVNQRPVLTKKGWRNPGATVGAPDIVACLPGGRLLVMELKTGKAELRPEQRRMMERWTLSGAAGWVIHDVAELNAKLLEWASRSNPLR
jgi:hypothetical protein